MTGLTITPGTPSGLSWDGAPLELWGVRVASAAVRDEWTEALLAHLDEYRAYGVNALTVFYQGSSGGSLQAFASDGTEVDAGVQRRMERIVEAAGERGMIVVAGIFYQAQIARLDPENGPWLASRDAYLRAAERVARRLRPYRNVIINVANEHNTRRWASCPYPMQTVDGIVQLCLAVKEGDPERLVGGGGVHPGVNVELSLRPELDVLMFDWHGPSAEAVAAYRAAGSTKPLMNVELFGGHAEGFAEEDDVAWAGQNLSWPGWKGGAWEQPPAGRRRIQGVFPPGRQIGRHKGMADFLEEIAFAARTPGFSLFGHFPGWYQGISRCATFDNRFDLGGGGTRADPGIRWYFEAVAMARGLRSSNALRPEG